MPCAIDCRVGCAHPLSWPVTTPPANVGVDAQPYAVLSECGIPSGLPREGTLKFTHGHRLVMKELHIIGIRALVRHGGASTTPLTHDRLSPHVSDMGMETPSIHRRSTADTSPLSRCSRAVCDMCVPNCHTVDAMRSVTGVRSHAQQRSSLQRQVE